MKKIHMVLMVLGVVLGAIVLYTVAGLIGYNMLKSVSKPAVTTSSVENTSSGVTSLSVESIEPLLESTENGVIVSSVGISENVEKMNTDSITYTDCGYKTRLVVKPVFPRIYPGETKLINRGIDTYTVVNVIDSGLLEAEGREQWLYVTFPVYDTPMDNHGWIKESDTVKLTKNNREQVRSRVGVKNGKNVYAVDLVSEISKATPTKVVNISGKIDKESNGYVWLTCAGGEAFWVEKKDIVYPDAEE